MADDALDWVGLTPLMQLSSGRQEVGIGLLDGPVAAKHPDLASASISEVPSGRRAGCTQTSSAACLHGTFTAGILSAKRDGPAPAICPGCSLLVRPVFKETYEGNGAMLSATPGEVAEATIECIEAGARVLNLSIAFAQPSVREERELERALDYAAQLGIIIVAAAGNQGTLASSAITRHRWVIPVAACDLRGRPVGQTNLGGSVGRRGLMAPGEGVTSLGVEGKPYASGGTSVAAPFVTGAIALLWSEFPDAGAAEVKSAVTGAGYTRRRTTVVPPMLDAWAAYQVMVKAQFLMRRKEM